MRSKILVLNRNYRPIDIGERDDVFGKIWSNGMNPLDLIYEEDEHGCVNPSNVSYFSVVEGSKDWCKVPVRPYDDYIQTVRGPIRVPAVVICSRFEDVPESLRRGLFPTKFNVMKRDNHICQYTSIRLNKETQSIDHIFPVSRCFDNPNTWENQVACHRELNTWKADRLPEECDIKDFNPICPLLKEWKKSYNKKTLKLIKYPVKPKGNNSMVFSDTMDAWNIFLKGV